MAKLLIRRASTHDRIVDLSRIASDACRGSRGLLLMYQRKACASRSSFIGLRRRRASRLEADRRSRPAPRTRLRQVRSAEGFPSPKENSTSEGESPLAEEN